MAGWASAALAAALVVAPLVTRAGERSPFGRPWYVGNGLVLLGLMLALLFGTRELGWRGVGGRTRRRVAVVALLVASYLAYVSNYATLTAGDCLPNRAVPLALASGDGFDLARVVPRALHDHYAFLLRDGRLLSAYPLGTGLLLVPYYGLLLAVSGLGPEQLFDSLLLEKHAAALLACASVGLLLAGARPWLRFRHRLLAAAALAFGTQWLPTVGQALWSTTGAAFCATAALALAAARRSRVAAPLGAGAAAGLQLMARPNAIALLPLTFAATSPDRARGVRAAVALALALAGLAGLNLVVYGRAVGGYESIQLSVLARESDPFLVRFAGVLASPSRGLLWHFPVLLLAAPVAVRASRSPRARRIAWASLASVAGSVLINALWPAWWGGHSLGPRLLAEVSLPAAILSGLAWARLERRSSRTLLAALLVYQALLGFGLAHSEPARRWNHQALAGSPPHPALWSVRASQWLAALCPPCAETPTAAYLRPGDGRARRAIDLAAAADAPILAADPARPALSIHLPRLAAASPLEIDATGFDFLRAADRAAVRVCAGESSKAVALPGGPGRRLRTVILWATPDPPPPGTRVGELVLESDGGARTVLPLRADRELFATDPERRGRAPRPEQLVGGDVADLDSLIEQRLRVPRGARRARVLRLRSTGEDQGCLYWLAGAVERPRPRATP